MIIHANDADQDWQGNLGIRKNNIVLHVVCYGHFTFVHGLPKM